jgi:hypothetical protein
MPAAAACRAGFAQEGAGFFGGLSFYQSGEMTTEATRFIGPDECLGCFKERWMGRYLLLKRGLRQRDFRLSESCATPAFKNSIMKPDDASRGVHYHQFFYRINPDKTVDSICAFCYLTAATANSQAELHELERAHRCPE